LLKTGWISFELPIVNSPGNRFYYKDVDAYLLVAIIETVFDMTFEEIVYNYLYEPLGIKIENITITRNKKLPNLENISMLNNSDLQKIASLCLNKGCLNGKQLLNGFYFEDSVQKQIDTNEFIKYFQSNDYGYLWWIYNGAYFARGFGGKELAIFPNENLSIVLQTQPLKKSREYLDIIFDIILPSFG